MDFELIIFTNKSVFKPSFRNKIRIKMKIEAEKQKLRTSIAYVRQDETNV